MLKHRISLERQINDRLYQFSVPYEAPLSEVSAIIEDLKLDIANRIAEVERQAKEKQEQKEPELEQAC